jgi:uncharacterized LabA/DUF88 family protein
MRIRESLIDMDQIAVGSGNELGGTAVFFDFENIILGIHESFKVHKIIDHLTERGEVMIRRAYADWGRYRQYQRQFLEEGVQMVFLPSYGTSDKNRTDTAICVDAMEILFRREHIDTFVICSGDSDFGVLAQRLRDYGKRIVGISARSAASQILVKQCHEFIFYESLVGLAMKDYSRDEGEARMKRALVQLVDEYGRQFRASLLKDRMRKQDSTFSEKNYGASNFTRFLKSYPRVVRVLDGGKVEVLWTPEADFGESASPRNNGAAPARGPGGRSGAGRAPATPPPAALSPPLAPPPALPAKPAGAPAEAVQPEKMTPKRKQEIAALLERAFAQSLGSAASIRMGQLKETLVSMSPGFDEGRLGFRSFASFLKAFPTVVTLDRYRDDVRPVGTDVPFATSPEVMPVVGTETAELAPVEPATAAVVPEGVETKEAATRKAGKKPATKKPTAKKPTTKKPTPKKATAKKATPKKATAKKAAAKKTTAKKATPKKAAPKKASAQKAPDPATDR